MVRIRMQRLGRIHKPFYRISAIDQRTRRDGRVIEQLGWYDPVSKDAATQIKLDEERCRYWLAKGAQPSDTVRDVFAKRKLIPTGPWEKTRSRQRDIAKAKAEAAAAAPAEGAKKDAAKPAAPAA
ncbi:MAG: 30S ribosomal protein S16 [Phycisphaerales bacterium]|nr:30S ribosomal protein S16 [Phycisphaerales bacterium]